MEDTIAIFTSGFILMRFVELAILSYILYRVLRRDVRPARVRAKDSFAHERARAAHSDKD